MAFASEALKRQRETRNEQLQAILKVYLMSANTEQELRRTWSMACAIFQKKDAGYLVRLEKHKAIRKQQLGLILNERECKALGFKFLSDEIAGADLPPEQPNFEVAEMEGNLQ